MTIDREQLKSQLKQMIAQIAGVPITGLDNEDLHFVKDLGLDSMLLLEMLSQIEQTYNLTIKEDDFYKMTTLKACREMVESYSAKT